MAIVLIREVHDVTRNDELVFQSHCRVADAASWGIVDRSNDRACRSNRGLIAPTRGRRTLDMGSPCVSEAVPVRMDFDG